MAGHNNYVFIYPPLLIFYFLFIYFQSFLFLNIVWPAYCVVPSLKTSSPPSFYFSRANSRASSMAKCSRHFLVSV
jgi:hypothetical protein